MGNTMRKLLALGCGCALAAALSLAGSNVAWAGAAKAAGSTNQATARMVAAEVTTAPLAVDEIDKDHRKLTLLGPDGEKTIVSVPAGVQGFEQLKKGDKIEVEYYRSLAMQVVPPGEAGRAMQQHPKVKTTSVGGVETHETTTSAQVVSINRTATDSTIAMRGPDGRIQTVSMTASDPATQSKLGSLKPGDVVQLTYAEGVVGSIRPLPK